ncbi:unnamed protein product, partial [marine sediment metagenome]
RQNTTIGLGLQRLSSTNTAASTKWEHRTGFCRVELSVPGNQLAYRKINRVNIVGMLSDTTLDIDLVSLDSVNPTTVYSSGDKRFGSMMSNLKRIDQRVNMPAVQNGLLKLTLTADEEWSIDYIDVYYQEQESTYIADPGMQV